MKTIELAVNGTLMRGFALNRNLLDVGAEFITDTTTAPVYRLWSINDEYPAMLRDDQAGGQISVEIWELTPRALVEILNKEPPGLSIGWVELSSGQRVLGVLAEPYLCEGQKEITAFGGWRNYILPQ